MADDVEIEIGNRSVRISNPDRVYFPARGETKLDLVRLPASPRDCKWFHGGSVYGLGRASLCSLALIAAGFLRAAGRVRGREAPAQRRRRRP
jgi:hypothetical protein